MFGLLASADPARADLINLGNGMIYDNTRDITWLQDVMFAATSGYDADGRMTVQNAVTWASKLEYGGFDDWRLPNLYQPGWALLGNGEVPNLMADLGWQWVSRGEGYPWLIPPACAAAYEAGCWSASWQSPFLNLPSLPMLWAGGLSDQVWVPIYGVDGTQRGDEAVAWAVRDGNAAVAVPEPSTLVVLSLGALMCLRRRKRSGSNL